MTDATANDEFKKSYSNWVSIGLFVAVAAHFGFVQVFPQLQASDVGVSSDEMENVNLPPEVEIPPPPEQISRPATPQVAEANVDEDVTIAPTTFEDNPVERLPPPPETGSVRDRPSFIPRDVDPRLRNKGEIQQLLQRRYPPRLKDAEIGGRVVLWLFVDANGEVAEIQIQQSSGYDAFDQAAVGVVQNMDFSPAINQDKPIGVWINWPVAFRVQ